VVVVHGDREDLLGPILADDVGVQMLVDLGRRWQLGQRQAGLGGGGWRGLFVDDLTAQIDTFVADVHRARAGDQPPYLVLALAAERTVVLPPRAACSRHRWLLPSRRGPLALAVAGFASRGFTCVD